MSFLKTNQMFQHTMAAVAIGTAALGAVQVVGGAIGKSKANKETQNLIKQRKAFETPDDILKIVNATQSRASNGLGAETLNYLTNQNERAFSGAIGSANLLGGDPNAAAAIFDQNFNNLIKIGSDNHAANLANFTQYLGALNTKAENAAAEQISKDNLIKDALQASTAKSADAARTMNNGINTIVSAGTSYASAQLGTAPSTGNGGSGTPLTVNNTPMETIPLVKPIFSPGLTPRR